MKTYIPFLAETSSCSWYISLRFPLAFLLVFLISRLPVQCQSDPLRKLAQEIRSNVVAIHSEFKNDEEKFGFGFVVGQKNNKLNVVTASHVVLNEKNEKARIDVKFPDASIIIPEVKIFKWSEDDDLCLLQMAPIQDITFVKKCFSKSYHKHDKVRFVGRDNEIELSIEGEITKLKKGDIEFAGMPVAPGTSGAPLIGKRGIVGMVVKADIANATALGLERILELTDEWIGKKHSGHFEFISPKNETLVLGMSGVACLSGIGFVFEGARQWNEANVWYRSTYSQNPIGADGDFEKYEVDYNTNAKLLMGLGTAAIAGGAFIILNKMIKGGASTPNSLSGNLPTSLPKRMLKIEPLLGKTWEGLTSFGIAVRFNRD
jgi:hypothetical protein